MTSLPRFSVENPVLVNLFMATLLVGGGYCGLTLVREMFPESRPRQIIITTAYPGATPAEVEKGITLKIEEQIKDVEGVEKISSVITEGRSMILIDLQSGFSAIDRAINDVKAAIDSIPSEDFPEEALETQVSKFEPQFPVIMVSVYGDLDDRTLKTLGERLREDLLALPNVTELTLNGTRKDEISVEVQPRKLAEFDLSFMEVAEAIAQNNLDLPGGQLRTHNRNVAVRTLGEKQHGEDLGTIVIRGDRAGRLVRVQDVARIVDGFEDIDVSGRFHGKPSVSVRVSKTPQQDAIAIAGAVRALVAGKMGRPLERSWTDRLLAGITGHDPIAEIYDRARNDPYPPGIGIETHSDLSRFIEGRLDLLMRNGLWGLLLVFLSLLVFLHWRVAFWVMMGLVLAVTGSLIGMKILGVTLNMISAFGLIIVLGLLVDDAIIVSEHIYSKVEEGVEPKLAAITATEAVTWPVVCAILTTIVAFVPLMSIEGQIGDWMGVLPLVVCIALIVSLAEALVILPSHLGHSLRLNERRDGRTEERRDEGKGVDWRDTRPSMRIRAMARRFRRAKESWLLPKMRRSYEKLLRTATAYRYVVVGGLFSCMLIVVGAVLGGHIPFVFLQKVDSELIIVNLKLAVGAPTHATRKALGVVERAALELDELRTVQTLAGIQLSESGLPSTEQSHLGQAFIELTTSDDRTRTSNEIVQELRARILAIPGVESLKFFTLDGGPGGAAIHLEITGKRLDDLVAVTADIKDRLQEFDGVFDIADDFDGGRPEAQIELFDSARALGLTTQSLATQVRAAFYGFEARKIQRGREDVRIMVRYPPESRRRIYDIESMRIAVPCGDTRARSDTLARSDTRACGVLIPFTEVARLTEGTGNASIHRIDQRRTITVTADVDDAVTTAGQVIAEVTAVFPEITRPYPGVELRFGGQQLETLKAFGSLKTGFMIALLLIYMILAGLFRSYVQPMIVMAVIPFGAIGAVTGHFVMGYPLTILSMIGFVALTGIVVNDSMILVVFINRRVAAGASAEEAVIEGGHSRLRPILLTSATTVLGIAPLLLETSFQAKFLIPMGVSISAGLIFATVLTLVAVPSLYLIVIDVKRALAAVGHWVTGPQASARADARTARILRRQ